MKSKILFNRLVGIDMLLTFEGIISSLADFQLKITSPIEQLNNTLLSEDCAKEES